MSAPSSPGPRRFVRTGGLCTAPCRKGTAVRMTLASLPSLAAGGAGLSALLAGAPWWAALLGSAVIALVPPVIAQLRAWSRDRTDREFQRAFIQFVNQLPEPEQKTQAMIDYRRAEPQPSTGNAEPTGQDPPPPNSAQNAADPQGP